MSRPVNRRIVFQGLGALGIAVALAGCGGGSGGGSPEVTAGADLASTSEVPVGGGLILTGPRVVITQPTSGDFKAFSAICTHEGNTVTSVADGSIQCSFHGSSYDAATGEPTGGPAPSALAPVAITVRGTKILAA